MAIERLMESPSGSNPEGGMGLPEPVDSGETPGTATIDAAVLGGRKVKSGDVIRLEVVSVDEESGAVEVTYAEETASPKRSRIEEAAEAYAPEAEGKEA